MSVCLVEPSDALKVESGVVRDKQYCEQNIKHRAMSDCRALHFSRLGECSADFRFPRAAGDTQFWCGIKFYCDLIDSGFYS